MQDEEETADNNENTENEEEENTENTSEEDSPVSKKISQPSISTQTIIPTVRVPKFNVVIPIRRTGTAEAK